MLRDRIKQFKKEAKKRRKIAKAQCNIVFAVKQSYKKWNRTHPYMG